MRYKKYLKLNQGFTIIELMIATVVFSVLLLLASTAVIFVSRQFNKGVVINRTQEVARTVTEEMSRNIQFSEKVPLANVAPAGFDGAWCIAGKGYAYNINKQLVDSAPGPFQSNAVLKRYDDCTYAGTGTELMGKSMRLSKLSISPVSIGGGNAWNINLIVAFGDTDLLEADEAGVANARCKSGPGSHFCSVSKIKLTVVKRIE